MRINSLFNQQAVTPQLQSVVENEIQKSILNQMCCRVGIIEEYYPENLTVDVVPVNKITKGWNADGSPVLKDWAKIRAVVCFADKYITQPINKGDECLLLFSDREIETWFINGNTNAIKHSRMHDETDCIAIMGVRSVPQLIEVLTDCVHLFYGNSDIQIHENNVDINAAMLNINGDTIQTGNTVITGTLTADGVSDTTGATGTLIDSNGKSLASVVNGIVKEIY